MAPYDTGGGGGGTLDGGGGADVLDGGRGVDQLTGGRGSDTFEFARGSGRDTITDYQDGSDMFQIGTGATSFADLTITQNGDDAQITFANVRITLQDIDRAVLDEGDFMFG